MLGNQRKQWIIPIGIVVILALVVLGQCIGPKNDESGETVSPAVTNTAHD